MTLKRVVFLLDVDNTVLGNDRVVLDLMRYLEREVGHERQQRYRVEYPHDPHLLTVSHFLIDYPFANRLFSNSLDLVDRFKQWGPKVIFSDGDVVFPPLKIERYGLLDAVDKNVLIYIHKELELENVESRYPSKHYVLVDDKLRISTAIMNIWGTQVTTVFPRQGHYARDTAVLTKYPPADVSIERVGELLNYDLQSRLAA